MSVVAVRRYDNEIILSADKQTTWGDAKMSNSKDQMYENKSKIYSHNDIAFGSAGKVYESGLFYLYTKTRKPTAATPEAILEYFVEFKDWATKKDATFALSNQYIFVYEDNIFQTYAYEVAEIKEYSAIGSGMFLALGAMYMGARPEQAVNVSKEFDLYCGGGTDTIIVKKESHEQNRNNSNNVQSTRTDEKGGEVVDGKHK